MLELPPRVATLPVDSRGYPILYTAYRDPETDEPDFRISSEERRQECMRRKLCGVCGQALEYWIYFIGGPLSAANRTYFDPPMHEECARFSIEVCPYLANQNAQRAKLERYLKNYEAGEVQVDGASVREHPGVIHLFKTRSYKPRPTEQMTYFHAGPATHIEIIELAPATA